jgi:hypothetical protein
LTIHNLLVGLRPEAPKALEVVKPVAERLKAFALCDHGTSDISHVWRVPGALNWPNAKKVAEGRAREPQLVRVKKWDINMTSLQSLNDALPQGKADPERKERASTPAARSQPANRKRGDHPSHSKGIEVPVAPIAMKSLPSELQDEIKRPAVGDRSKALFRVVAKMFEAGLDDQTIEDIIRAHPKGVGAKYADRDDLDRDIARTREKTAARSQDDKITSVVSEMNSKYAVVDDNGKTVVVYRREDVDLDRKYVVRASYQDFRNLYLNTQVLVTGPSGRPKPMTHADFGSHTPRGTHTKVVSVSFRVAMRSRVACTISGPDGG